MCLLRKQKTGMNMGKTILLVDDSALICHVVSKVLKDSGYTVLTAKNGREGVSLARQHVPNLVIMDVEMPVMDGIDATRQIKSEPVTAQIPVVIFTSLGREEDIDRAKQAGCEGFLSKPICKEALNSEVQRILQSHG